MYVVLVCVHDLWGSYGLWNVMVKFCTTKVSQLHMVNEKFNDDSLTPIKPLYDVYVQPSNILSPDLTLLHLNQLLHNYFDLSLDPPATDTSCHTNTFCM